MSIPQAGGKMIWNTPDRSSIHFIEKGDFSFRTRLLRWLGRQIWMPAGQDRLLRGLWHPDSGKHYFFEVDFFGKRYRGDLAHYIDWLVFCYGGAPYSELSLLRDVAAEIRGVRTGVINFFDVGANAGHHSLFMASVADMVVAFEPMPTLQALIKEKIAINGLNNIQLMPIGLGEHDQALDYFAGEGANSGVGSFLPTRADSVNAPISLAVKNGDAFFAEMNLPRIDVMKVDVEGFEPFVFRGLAKRIRQDRPVILTEMTDSSRDGFGSEAQFRECFYEGAEFAEVTGRLGHAYTLKPFSYEKSAEILITPPEQAEFMAKRLRR